MAFELGKSYQWVFGIFAALMAALIVASVKVAICFVMAIVLLPVFMGFVFLSELQSEVVLDSWWRASYPKGSGMYRERLINHGMMTVIFSVFALIVSQMR